MVFVPLIVVFGVLAFCFIDVDFDGIGFFLTKFFFTLCLMLTCIALMFGIVALPAWLGLTGLPAIGLVGFILLVVMSALIASIP
jgi:hypothetical protein